MYDMYLQYLYCAAGDLLVHMATTSSELHARTALLLQVSRRRLGGTGSCCSVSSPQRMFDCCINCAFLSSAGPDGKDPCQAL